MPQGAHGRFATSDEIGSLSSKRLAFEVAEPADNGSRSTLRPAGSNLQPVDELARLVLRDEGGTPSMIVPEEGQTMLDAPVWIPLAPPTDLPCSR